MDAIVFAVLITLLVITIHRYTKAKSAVVKTVGTVSIYGIISSVILFYPLGSVA